MYSVLCPPKSLKHGALSSFLTLVIHCRGRFLTFRPSNYVKSRRIMTRALESVSVFLAILSWTQNMLILVPYFHSAFTEKPSSRSPGMFVSRKSLGVLLCSFPIVISHIKTGWLRGWFFVSAHRVRDGPYLQANPILGFPSISLVTVDGRSGSLVGQGFTCNRVCGCECSSASFNSLDVGESSGYCSDMASKNISLEPPSVVFTGEARYLTPLWVFGKGCELSKSATTEGFELRAGNIDIHDQTTHHKIKVALKLLALREQHLLVQFWSPRVVGKQHQLTTIDQPFGFGLCDDQRLISYRKDSECKIYDVDKDYNEEEDVSPLVRVFRQGLSEWSLDVTKYLPKHFPQQECAIRCNLHGYLALPAFDPTTRLCVGVLEIDHEGKQNELNKIYDLLKVVCDTHRLPLAQTGRCLGKDCMSTVSLPFRVQDMGLWPFKDAYATKLSEEEYPLVSHAGMSGLTSCVAIYLHSVGTNDGDFLEFFLPSRLEDTRYKLKSSYMKQGRKRKRGSEDTMVLVTVTYGEDIKSFRFPISLGLLKLKKEVAKRFKLISKMICLIHTDEDNDLILICVDKDLEDAMVASGSKNSMNLICKPSAD
ncbi:NIN-like protein [Tanacetum coccineum]|uniref:NIN-like protein n=1 Tax=Tanacetum coccineum TaxID=301880 RepID=A0ABQ5AX31_9ASTR